MCPLNTWAEACLRNYYCTFLQSSVSVPQDHRLLHLILENLLPHLFEAIADHIDGDPVVQALTGNELACFMQNLLEQSRTLTAIQDLSLIHISEPTRPY